MKITLNKKEKYILGCSGGPDSMCLLSILHNEGYDFIVCNIDYNYRDNSIEETDLVKKFCKENNIAFYTKSVQYPYKNGNFEAWARDIRYEYFMEIGHKYNINNILIAHNQDDLLETYFLQKERKSLVSYFGLNKSYMINNFNIIRPLLNYSKSQLKEYCDQNNIKYIIDPTNSDVNYRRNYYRHNIVKVLNNEDRKLILEEIVNKNKELENIKQEINNIVGEKSYIKIKDYINFNEIEKQIAIIHLLNNKKIHASLSLGFITELDLAVSLNNMRFKREFLNNTYTLSLDYDVISIYKNEVNYEIEITKNTNNKYFNLTNFFNKNPNFEKILVKPALKGKYYLIGSYQKKVNRIFIDWKAPHYLRPIWPGIFDGDGKLIYIPRYQKNYKINKESYIIFDTDEIIELENY